MSFIRFLNPVALALAASLPLAVWLAARSLAGPAGLRRAVAVALRLIVLSLLVMALAEAALVRRYDQMCVFFLADRSSSIPSEDQHTGLQIVNVLCEKATEKDRAGLIVFGGDAAIEVPPVSGYAALRKTSVECAVRREETDIGGAIQLALAAFPENCLRRVVLITDGNQNRGDALEQARNARAAGAEVWVLPYRLEATQEVLVARVLGPGCVQRSESFDVKTVVESSGRAPATLRLYQDDQLIASEAVTLERGKNVFAARRQLDERGFYTFRAVVESPADTLAQNNEGYAFAIVRGDPRVLVVEGQPGEARYLTGFLRKENVEAEMVGVGQMPAGVGKLQSYDAILFVNVPAFDLSLGQMREIDTAVRDFGTGFVMVGGDRSFGAGGYQGTPIEEALPVSMEVEQKKVMPNGALVMVLHTCEMPDGNTWAVQIAKEAVNALSPYDMVGVLAYDWQGGDAWSIPLQVIGSKVRVHGLIEKIAPADMPSFDPTLKMALAGLKECRTASKHIVVISDGDPSPPGSGLVKQVADAGISISTVIIAPHGVSDYSVMRGLARDGNGRFYDAKSPSELPRIFIKEALMVRRSLIFEKRFTPRVAGRTEPLLGISGALPDLLGYVTTTAKARAQVSLVGEEPNEDPILAQWRYGLGKSAAFTSDAKNRWAAEWVGWGQFGKFWTQLVRWAMRSVPASDLNVSTHVEDGAGRISADAVDARGEYINLLRLRAEVVSPRLGRRTVDLRQTAPGHYEGSFPTDEVGAYLIRVGTFDKEDNLQAMQVTGLSKSYSSEYRDLSTNYPLLQAVAREGGGRVMALKDNVFERDAKAVEASREIWWALALAALLILPLDIAVRRLVIDPAPLYRLLRRAARVLLAPLSGRRRRDERRDEVMERLRATKAAARAARPSVAVTPPAPPGETRAPAAVEPEAAPAPSTETKEGKAPGAQEKKPEEPSEYTRRLLDAKKRALRGKGGE